MHKSYFMFFFLFFQNSCYSISTEDLVVEAINGLLYFYPNFQQNYNPEVSEQGLRELFSLVKLELQADDDNFWYKNSFLFPRLERFLKLYKKEKISLESAATKAFINVNVFFGGGQTTLNEQSAITFVKIMCEKSRTLNKLLNDSSSDGYDEWIIC